MVWGAVLVGAVALVTTQSSRFGRGPTDDESRRDAELAARSGHWEAAAAALKGVRARAPSDSMLLGQAYAQLGDPGGALAALAAVPDADPFGPRARLAAGQIEFRRDHARAAEALLAQAVGLDPGLVAARRERIALFALQQRAAELDAEFAALARHDSLTLEDVFYWCSHRGQIVEAAKAVPALRRFINADPDDARSRVALAAALRSMGKPEDADKELAGLSVSDPEVRLERARIALDLGDPDAADALIDGGPPGHGGLALLRARRAVSRRDWAAAVVEFQCAYNYDNRSREALFGLGQALRRTGKEAQARRYLDRAERLERLGLLVQRFAARRGTVVPPEVLRELGSAHEDAGRRDEARAWYRLAVTADPLGATAQQALYRLDSESAAGPPAP